MTTYLLARHDYDSNEHNQCSHKFVSTDLDVTSMSQLCDAKGHIIIALTTMASWVFRPKILKLWDWLEPIDLFKQTGNPGDPAFYAAYQYERTEGLGHANWHMVLHPFVWEMSLDTLEEWLTKWLEERKAKAEDEVYVVFTNQFVSHIQRVISERKGGE